MTGKTIQSGGQRRTVRLGKANRKPTSAKVTGQGISGVQDRNMLNSMTFKAVPVINWVTS